MSTRIILASASPRRKEILAQAGLSFEVICADCEECSSHTEPTQYVQEIARRKADAVAEKCGVKSIESAHNAREKQDVLIIAADTVVVHRGKILGKPLDQEDAFHMLSILQGDSHYVYTGVALFYRTVEGREKVCTFSEGTQVHVAPVSSEALRAYISTGEPMDKAGGYGIQGGFARYIQGIHGDYYNVVGFPLCRFFQEWEKWNY